MREKARALAAGRYLLEEDVEIVFDACAERYDAAMAAGGVAAPGLTLTFGLTIFFVLRLLKLGEGENGAKRGVVLLIDGLAGASSVASARGVGGRASDGHV